MATFALSSIYQDLNLLTAFRQNGNGSWSALRAVCVRGVAVEAGFTFSEDVSIGGQDLAAILRDLAKKYPKYVQT